MTARAEPAHGAAARWQEQHAHPAPSRHVHQLRGDSEGGSTGRHPRRRLEKPQTHAYHVLPLFLLLVQSLCCLFTWFGPSFLQDSPHHHAPVLRLTAGLQQQSGDGRVAIGHRLPGHLLGPSLCPGREWRTLGSGPHLTQVGPMSRVYPHCRMCDLGSTKSSSEAMVPERWAWPAHWESSPAGPRGASNPNSWAFLGLHELTKFL